ncbi:MAG: zf-HC2 domain-containing protein [Treponema sp.]|nr:zf-HC2 domain-containing protein [Treponema sp.]
MCPDRQILSVYFDNELSSPWKEKLEEHLSGCRECAARLEAYKKTRAFLPGVEQSALRAAEDRIWGKIAPLKENYRQSAAAGSFWGARVTVPFPLAAAAGIVLVAAFALLLVFRPVSTPVSQFAGTGMEVQSISDINSLLEYLDSDNSADMVIIKLPETTFTSYGEPRVLRAADYSRDNWKR